MLNPVAMSIIRNVFEDPRERAQAIGVWGGVIGISLALGPVVGGALTDSVGWPAVFLVNLPIGFAAIILTALFVPESRAEHPRRIDPVGQVLVILGLATLTYAIIEGPTDGWLSPRTLAEFAIAVVALVSLVRYELCRHQPLIEVRFFASVPFSGASAIALGVFAALGGFLFLNTLYLQNVRGLSPFDAGLYTLPMAGVTLVVAPLSGRLVGNRGARVPLVIGSLGLLVSAAILTQLTATTPFWLLIVTYLIFGLGFGMINPPITNTAVSGMPPSQAGVASAVASTARQVGSTLGVAVLGALAGASAADGMSAGFSQATHVSWWIIVGLALVTLVLAIVTTTSRARATAVKTAERFREDGPSPDPPADSEAGQPELVRG
jgi:EmrB/QacA subfamily drug resistance transporter